MKILMLLDDDEESDLMMYVNGFVDEYVENNLNPVDVSAYMRNRLMTYLVSKLGKCLFPFCNEKYIILSGC